MRIAIAITTAALMFLAACGGTPTTVGFAPIDHVCAAGQQIECACPGEAQKSVQSCRSDGSGYDACACSIGGDAGTGGDVAPSGDTLSPKADGGVGGDAVSSDGGPVIGPDAGGSDAAPCSVSLDSDPDNCGACGHSCLGGACQAGVCAFTELASNQAYPSNLAVGSDTLFWTTEGANPDYIGSISAQSLSDLTASPALLATNQKYPRALTFADGSLYWGSIGNGAMGKWTASTGATSDVGTLTNGRLSNAVTDAKYVYFAVEAVVDPSGTMPTFGAVARCPLDGCGGSPPEIIATDPKTIIGLAIDRGVLFWSVYATSGAIYRLTLNGASSPRAIAVGQALPLNLAAFGGFVYWVNVGSGTIARANADDDTAATPTILASNQSSPWGIAADDRGVYWTTSPEAPRTGQVMKLPYGASTPLVLASEQASPGHVRLDASYAYWTTNTGNGSIRRVAK